MATEIPPILIEFQGDIKGIKDSVVKVQQDLNKVNEATEKAAKHQDKLKASSVALGSLMASAFQVVGNAALNFGKQTVTAFTDTAKETKQLQRVLGGTPEQMSRLVYASDRLGVSTGVLTSFMTRLGVHMSANDKAAAALGVAYRDQHGALLPSNVVLGNLADKFAKLPAGMDKTALAVKAFGRGGIAMLPILNKGSEGLQKLYEEADNLGVTLTSKNLQAVTDYTNAQKNMHDGIKSLQFTIGKELVPKLSTLFNIFSNLITQISHFVNNNKTLVKIVLITVTAFVALYGAVKAYNKISEVCTGVIANVTKAYKALAAGEYAAQLEVIAIIAIIIALVEAFFYVMRNSKTFRDILQKVFEAIGTAAGTYIKFILNGLAFLVSFFGTAIEDIVKVVAKLKGPLNAMGIHWADGMDGVAQSIENGKNAIIGKLHEWADKAPAIGKSVGDSIFNAIDKASKFDVMGYFHKLTQSLSGDSGVPSDSGVNLPNAAAGAGLNPKSRKAINAAAAYIRALNATIQQEDAKFKLAMSKSEKLNFADRLKIVKEYMNQNKKLIQAAQDEEKKTRGTKNHTAAVATLSKAIAEQAKMQNQANKITREAAKALQSQAQANNALLQSQQNQTSWLAAHNIAQGQTNAGSITVPVVIDGHEVFRVVQKYANQNNRRNITTGIGLSGAVI